jgi:hypothetical protein
MGVVKGAAKHTVKMTANKAMDEMGVVGDVIDRHTTTGPLDAADDAIDTTKKNVDKKVKKTKKNLKK